MIFSRSNQPTDMKTSQMPSIDTEQYVSIPRAWLADIIDDTAASYEMLTTDIHRLRGMGTLSSYALQTLYKAQKEIQQRLDGYRRAYDTTEKPREVRF